MGLDSAGVSVGISAAISNALDLAVRPSATLSYAKSLAFTSGAGVGQVDRVFSDQVTIAASGTQDFDLAGVLLDALGSTITLARVKLVAVYAASANINNVVVGAGTNPITTIMGGTTPTTIVRPGGLWLVTAPDATGYAVTAGTGDILRLTNSGAGSTVTADIIIMGSST